MSATSASDCARVWPYYCTVGDNNSASVNISATFQCRGVPFDLYPNLNQVKSMADTQGHDYGYKIGYTLGVLGIEPPGPKEEDSQATTLRRGNEVVAAGASQLRELHQTGRQLTQREKAARRASEAVASMAVVRDEPHQIHNAAIATAPMPEPMPNATGQSKPAQLVNVFGFMVPSASSSSNQPGSGQVTTPDASVDTPTLGTAQVAPRIVPVLPSKTVGSSTKQTTTKGSTVTMANQRAKPRQPANLLSKSNMQVTLNDPDMYLLQVDSPSDASSANRMPLQPQAQNEPSASLASDPLFG